MSRMGFMLHHDLLDDITAYKMSDAEFGCNRSKRDKTPEEWRGAL
jgi:hypothetical protein